MRIWIALALLAADPPPARDAAAKPLACPGGTERKGAAPPEGFEVWCERPDAPPERRKEGPLRAWYDDGALAREEGHRAGGLHGTFTEWHRNGKPARAGAYRDDAREGTWRVWLESGALVEECGYERGEQHGRFAAWWPGGKRKVEGRFCHGLQCGRWTTWDEEGRELGSVVYEEIRKGP